jgi:starch synthase
MLRILIMTAEMSPLAGSEGAATVVGPLAHALRAQGHDVRMAMPRYAQLDAAAYGLRALGGSFNVPMDHRHESATAFEYVDGEGLPVYLLDNPRYFGGGRPSLGLEDAERFIFFARGTLELLKRPAVSWQPDVIHCHDWHTAIVPNWLSTVYARDPFFQYTATVFTIHRLDHQGVFGYRVLEWAGLEQHGFILHAELSDLIDLVDLMARGIHFSDAVTTVSECYAHEIQTPEFGERLDPLLRERREQLFGVLSGVDMRVYNPALDSALASRYDATTLAQRAPNKRALQRAMGLREEAESPLVAMIGPFAEHKGLELLDQVMPALMAHTPAQFAFLVNGEARYRAMIDGYVSQYPGRVGMMHLAGEALERQAHAGSDLYVAPSYVEPCALHPMLAMCYGSVPVVRATGGLADVVKDYDARREEGNGFCFQPYEAMALYTALLRAVATFPHREAWAGLQRRGMASDFSWDAAAARYADVYRLAMTQRAAHNGASH